MLLYCDNFCDILLGSTLHSELIVFYFHSFDLESVQAFDNEFGIVECAKRGIIVLIVASQRHESLVILYGFGVNLLDELQKTSHCQYILCKLDIDVAGRRHDVKYWCVLRDLEANRALIQIRKSPEA